MFAPIHVTIKVKLERDTMTDVYPKPPLAFEDMPQIDRLTLMNISDETVRTYYTMGVKVHEIVDPIAVYIRPGGTTHRVVDSTGLVHCVAFPNMGRTTFTWRNHDQTTPVKSCEIADCTKEYIRCDPLARGPATFRIRISCCSTNSRSDVADSTGSSLSMSKSL